MASDDVRIDLTEIRLLSDDVAYAFMPWCPVIFMDVLVPDHSENKMKNSKIVKISQQVAKLCQKLKWCVFFLGHGV